MFQTRGPATVKARLPTVESLTGGTSRRLVPAERNVRRPGRSAAGTRGPKYRGALPLRTCVVIYFLTYLLAHSSFDFIYFLATNRLSQTRNHGTLPERPDYGAPSKHRLPNPPHRNCRAECARAVGRHKCLGDAILKC